MSLNTKTAYLIVICDPVTNAIQEARVWSSPEWEQSRQLSSRTYVAWQMGAETFQKAKDMMLADILEFEAKYRKPHRYAYLLPYLRKSGEIGLEFSEPVAVAPEDCEKCGGTGTIELESGDDLLDRPYPCDHKP